MSKALLITIALLFGLIVLLMIFAHMIVWPLFLPLILLVVLWYTLTFLVTERMARKKWPSLSFFLPARMIKSDGEDMVHGAVIVCDDTLIFIRRKDAKGSLEIVWTTSREEISALSLDPIDRTHPAFKITTRDERTTSFISYGIKKKIDAFRTAINIENTTN